MGSEMNTQKRKTEHKRQFLISRNKFLRVEHVWSNEIPLAKPLDHVTLFCSGILHCYRLFACFQINGSLYVLSPTTSSVEATHKSLFSQTIHLRNFSHESKSESETRRDEFCRVTRFAFRKPQQDHHEADHVPIGLCYQNRNEFVRSSVSLQFRCMFCY